MLRLDCSCSSPFRDLGGPSPPLRMRPPVFFFKSLFSKKTCYDLGIILLKGCPMPVELHPIASVCHIEAGSGGCNFVLLRSGARGLVVGLIGSGFIRSLGEIREKLLSAGVTKVSFHTTSRIASILAGRSKHYGVSIQVYDSPEWVVDKWCFWVEVDL